MIYLFLITDNLNLVENDNYQLNRCTRHQQLWMDIEESVNKRAEVVTVFPTVLNALKSLRQNLKYDVLVTGSLHLIGAILSLTDFDLSSYNGLSVRKM